MIDRLQRCRASRPWHQPCRPFWRRLWDASLSALVVATAVSAPAAAAEPLRSAGSPEGYPLQIRHALGTAVIEQPPERIATVGWANHEVPLALGVVPVGFSAANYGDADGDGLLVWVAARLDELGATAPPLFDEANGIDVDAVAASTPDVILAAYSGLDADDYAELSEIAPVIAYPDTPWTTSWRDTIRLDSAGMGRAAAGERLIAKLDAQIETAASSHPELAGKTVMLATRFDLDPGGRIGFYTSNDPRVALLRELGLVSPPFVKAASATGAVAGSIDSARLDALEKVDILLTYGGQAMIERLRADPRTATLPAVENGAIVDLGDTTIGILANPTPLSIPWGLDAYVERLAAAARRAPAAVAPATSTDVSPAISTDASPATSTDASPATSIDASPATSTAISEDSR